MVQFFTENTWIISVAALIISILSVTFVIIDKFKVWGDSKKIRGLKKDKAILYPLLNVHIDTFATIKVEKNGNHQSTIHSAHFSKLYNLFQNIDTSKLRNRELAERIESIKNLGSGELFECKGVPDGDVFSTQFTRPVNETLYMMRKYLAEVI